MTTTTKIYRVTAQDHMVRYWHFPTKWEATVFAREWSKENSQDCDEPEPEIHILTIPLNARGIAKALNDFIDFTCANEG